MAHELVRMSKCFFQTELVKLKMEPNTRGNYQGVSENCQKTASDTLIIVFPSIYSDNQTL